MTENEISRHFVDAAVKIHTALGPGLLESVYQAAMQHELAKRGIPFQAKVPIPVVYDGVTIMHAFEADIVAERKVLIEIKSVEELAPVHFKVLLTYLKLSGIHLGIIINFNKEFVKNGIKRMANRLEE